MTDVKLKFEDFKKIVELALKECTSGYIKISTQYPKVIIRGRNNKEEDIEYIIYDESVSYSPRKRKEEKL